MLVEEAGACSAVCTRDGAAVGGWGVMAGGDGIMNVGAALTFAGAGSAVGSGVVTSAMS